MVRSYPRNKFLDILRDPLAVTIMASIGLHAALGAYLLPVLTKSQPEGKKAEPTPVKVVELTPNELQRIPQSPAPAPVAVPTPAPAAVPPVYQPSVPVAPTAPKFSTSIPISPIRTPPKKTVTQPPKTAKTPQPKKSPLPTKGTNFDPSVFDPAPTPQPTKSPTKPGKTTKVSPKPATQPTVKPTPQPVTPPTRTPVSTKPQQTTPKPNTDDDGANNAPPNQTTPPTTQQPAATPSPSPSGAPTTQQPSTPQNNGTPNDSGTKLFGNYDIAATARLQEYYKKYPDLKAYPTKSLPQQYPPGIPCSKVKQPPFIVLMVALDKVNPGQSAEILGNNSGNLPENEKPYIDGDPTILKNIKLLEIATTAGFSDATSTDINRPEVDKNRHVLYSYRVEFDPATCKN